MKVLMDIPISTTELKEIDKNDEMTIYSGYQSENGVCITLFLYSDGKRRIMVSAGRSMICEADLP